MQRSVCAITDEAGPEISDGDVEAGLMGSVVI